MQSILLASGNLTAVGQSVTCGVAGVGLVAVQMTATSAPVGHNAAFEVSHDGKSWSAISGARTNSSSVAESSSGVFGAAPAYGWEINVAGWGYFRVRCTAHTSGTASWLIGGSDADSEPVVVGPSAVALNAGSSLIGDVGLQARASATGAATIAKIAAAASTNTTLVKASAGRVLSVEVANVTAATVFLKLYNKASVPVIGTDIPVFVIPVAPNSARSISLAVGYAFSAGIAYAITGGAADADASAVTAGALLGAIAYA